ncbi:ParB N-terminal domain-containing protein [Halobacterium litoreum]|uniref:ParB-like nuclease domain-containing protein n=1 Tax=Halobacterium litoreum TaxID=2039234 RepID=A0ABD5NAW8_9EURY|nr:hypothetical protein [Halobacterium litoreum]UHH14670.1 hypothetical protein LT972_06630 [Halobacterium litoreum]
MSVGSAFGTLDDWLRGAGRRLVAERPELRGYLLRARDGYARAYVAARTATNRLRYDAPPEPYRLISVDPARIERVVEFDPPKFRVAGEVAGGDWDRGDDRFAEMDVYRAYERHFEDGVSWADTEFFDRIVAEIEAGVPNWGCTSREAFEARCERLDDLYDTIAREGYYTQDELLESGVSDPIKPQHELKTERLKDEIAVHVGRDGDLLFEDGRNRLSIAKILGLESVPVRVLRRHADWQAVRDRYVRGDPALADWDHPDLAALEFDSR